MNNPIKRRDSLAYLKLSLGSSIYRVWKLVDTSYRAMWDTAYWGFLGITFDLNDPKDSSKNDKAAQTGRTPKSLTLEIHHGGCFTPIPSSCSSGKLSRKGKSVRCGKCGNVGHNRKGCRGQGGATQAAGARTVSGQGCARRTAGARNVSG
ncbi:hypothetical protein Tco_0802832 [Tanacetum coccineum]|uniref:CCHC-type domain-containing protein n=1 Tax=Tanacetum coccineum TaxID=301880 RepID=A0ABQ4ZZX6_9ASTR